MMFEQCEKIEHPAASGKVVPWVALYDAEKAVEGLEARLEEARKNYNGMQAALKTVVDERDGLQTGLAAARKDAEANWNKNQQYHIRVERDQDKRITELEAINKRLRAEKDKWYRLALNEPTPSGEPKGEPVLKGTGDGKGVQPSPAGSTVTKVGVEAKPSPETPEGNIEYEYITDGCPFEDTCLGSCKTCYDNNTSGRRKYIIRRPINRPPVTETETPEGLKKRIEQLEEKLAAAEANKQYFEEAFTTSARISHEREELACTYSKRIAELEVENRRYEELYGKECLDIDAHALHQMSQDRKRRIAELEAKLATERNATKTYYERCRMLEDKLKAEVARYERLLFSGQGARDRIAGLEAKLATAEEECIDDHAEMTWMESRIAELEVKLSAAAEHQRLNTESAAEVEGAQATRIAELEAELVAYKKIYPIKFRLPDNFMDNELSGGGEGGVGQDNDKAKRDAEFMDMAARMIKVLDDNSHKSGWDEFAIMGAMDGVLREVAELQGAAADYKYAKLYEDEAGAEESRKEIVKEALDVANWIMFLLRAVKNEEELVGDEDE